MNIESQIRKLARSVYYQNLYKAAKELGTIHIFENISNFSGLQTLFLFWLNIYETLYSDLAHKEYKYLDNMVIENDVRCDAFLYWKSKIKEQELNKYKRDKQINNLKLKDKSNVTTFNVDLQN